MSFSLVNTIYDKTTLPTELNFYKQALKDIQKHGISSQIYYLLKEQGKLEQTPLFFQERLRESYNECLFQNLFIKNQLEKVLRTFEKIGIDVIPLKGTHFSEKYFGDLGARATSDIDLLIRKKDLEMAVNAVKLLGFDNEEGYIKGHFHKSFSKVIPGSVIPLTIEIHWDLLREDTACLNINSFWEEAHPIGTFLHIKELSHYHSFYMICLHGWRHNLGSLKYYLDILQILTCSGQLLDFQRLKKELKLHQTYKRIIRTLSIVHKEFPNVVELKQLPLKRGISYRKRISTNPIMKYSDFIGYQFLSFDSANHSIIEFKNWLSLFLTGLRQKQERKLND
ncbi:nucleotidyltransferase family protein [Neobacillus terrae]|uniref:nucleotidyltransferase family protein n=1 Tax=Neobacillus terrae TaxID=3034837 RepID=UPI001407BB47|nr:nucleotidyltransferase family protein [Neobacillus terrae]NHM29294.1 nucleotidyltransferase family protein [Neobacillus terrae]